MLVGLINKESNFSCEECADFECQLIGISAKLNSAVALSLCEKCLIKLREMINFKLEMLKRRNENGLASKS